MPGKSMEKRGKQTLFSSISYCFLVSISFPNRLLKPRHSKLITRMIPAWAVANCMRTHSYLLGPHIPSRSPFCRPRARSPAAAWSTWKIQHKSLRITHRMQRGMLVFRHCFLEKKHHLCNWNADTECTEWYRMYLARTVHQPVAAAASEPGAQTSPCSAGWLKA